MKVTHAALLLLDGHTVTQSADHRIVNLFFVTQGTPRKHSLHCAPLEHSAVEHHIALKRRRVAVPASLLLSFLRLWPSNERHRLACEHSHQVLVCCRAHASGPVTELARALLVHGVLTSRDRTHFPSHAPQCTQSAHTWKSRVKILCVIIVMSFDCVGVGVPVDQ